MAIQVISHSNFIPSSIVKAKYHCLVVKGRSAPVTQHSSGVFEVCGVYIHVYLTG